MGVTTVSTSLLTPAQAAEVLNIRPHRFYELCRSGIVPHIRLGRQIRVSPAALDRFIEDGGTRTDNGTGTA